MQQEYNNLGSVDKLSEILSIVQPKSIFLVTGKASYKSSGAKSKLSKHIAPYNVTHFDDFSVNPQLEDVRRGIRQYQENNCDLVIAVGGGSAIDVAKSINILAVQEKDLQKYITKELEITYSGKPLVAIPTTSGTGSEATHFAVVYIDKTKYSLGHKEFMLPDYVILDPSLTCNLPSKITASTGMDALCQAIESYWSIHSTKKSKQYASEAITLIFKNLSLAVNDSNIEYRKAIMNAANLAGKAINITKTTASHAISYPITSYFGVPHGHAVALTLGEMFVHNTQVEAHDCLDSRGIEYTKKTMNELIDLFEVNSSEEVNQKWQNLMDSIGLERSLSKLGVNSEEDINLIVKNGFNPERVKNNLRLLTEESLREILYKIK